MPQLVVAEDFGLELCLKLMSKSQCTVHFSTLFVDFFAPSSGDSVRVTLQLIEEDLGGPDDFYKIRLDIVVKHRPPAEPVSLSVDHLLTVRHFQNSTSPSVRLHAQAAVLFGTIKFPNGPDVCNAFLAAIRNHAALRQLHDPYCPGTLYAVEANPRMRRMAPVLTPLYYPQPGESHSLPYANVQYYGDSSVHKADDEDFGDLLSDLNLLSPKQRKQNAKPTRPANGAPLYHEFAMSLLTQFARVTQAARDAAAHVSNIVDEDRAQALRAREEAELSARSAALDVHAEIVASTTVEGDLPPRLELESSRGISISRPNWLANIDEKGKITDPSVVAHAVSAGSIDPPLRPSLWPFLLGFYPWDSSSEERSVVLQEARSKYNLLKQRTEESLEQAKTASTVAHVENDRKHSSEDGKDRLLQQHLKRIQVHDQIAKDVVRTDRKLDMFKDDDAPAIPLMAVLLDVYADHNPDIAYCQGMSDFLAPIMNVIGLQDEAMLFWCFEKLMNKMEANFRVDQSGMQAQLAKLKKITKAADPELAAYFEQTDPQYYSCFRWIVVRFKRELSFEDVTKLWEVLWSQRINCDDLHIFIAVGLLIAHRKKLLALEHGAFDRLLRYINDMSMRIDVDFAIHEGEWCYRKWSHVLTQS